MDRIYSKAGEVGKIVVNKCLKKGISINTIKLEKLLVLMQIECIKLSKKPLFKEDIEVWDCGPMIMQVDREFIGGAIEITEPYDEYIALLDAENMAVNNILRMYGEKDAFQLNKVSSMKKLCEMVENCENKVFNCNILTGMFTDEEYARFYRGLNC